MLLLTGSFCHCLHGLIILGDGVSVSIAKASDCGMWRERKLKGFCLRGTFFFYFSFFILNIGVVKPQGYSQRESGSCWSSYFGACPSCTWTSSLWTPVFGCQVFGSERDSGLDAPSVFASLPVRNKTSNFFWLWWHLQDSWRVQCWTCGRGNKHSIYVQSWIR